MTGNAYGDVRDSARALWLERLEVELAHLRAKRNAKYEIGSVFAVLARTLPMRTALGTEVVFEAEIDERGELRIGLENHRSPMAAIAAIGASLGDIGLAPE